MGRKHLGMVFKHLGMGLTRKGRGDRWRRYGDAGLAFSYEFEGLALRHRVEG